MNFCSGIKVRGVIPADQLVTGSLRRGRIDIRAINLLVIVEAEGQRLVVCKLHLIIVFIVRGGYQYNTNTIGVPFGVDSDVCIRHRCVKIKRDLAIRIGVPAGKVITINTVGWFIVSGTIVGILVQVRIIINTLNYLLFSLCNMRPLRNEVDIMLVSRVPKEDITVIIRKTSVRCYTCPGAIWIQCPTNLI